MNGRPAMGCRAVLLLKGPLRPPPRHHPIFFNDKKRLMSYSAPGFLRKCSTKATNDNGSSLPPPDVARLAQTARIRLAPHEVEEFEPKIRQMIDWFGQLQAVDLSGIEPAIRADTDGGNLREDVAKKFEEREAMIAAVPSYDEPYIKVPKVLNKD